MTRPHLPRPTGSGPSDGECDPRARPAIPATVLERLAGARILDDNLDWIEARAALNSVRVREDYVRAIGMKGMLPNPRPTAAQIEFTQRCNLTCSFCYNDSGPTNQDELPEYLLASVCDQLIELQVAELIISGGEPLMRPKHLGLILDRFADSGIPIHVLTNGTLLTSAWLRRLRAAGVVTLQVSLDGGDPRAHDSMRGQRGAWEKALAGLALASDHGLYTFASMVLTRSNAQTLPSLVDACYLAGCRSVNVGDLITWGRGGDYTAVGACTDDQFDEAAEFIRERGRALREQMELRLAVSMYFYICQLRYRGQESMLIRGDGTVRPHCTLSSIVCGSVYESRLDDIWERQLSSIHAAAEVDAILSNLELRLTSKLRQIRTTGRSP